RQAGSGPNAAPCPAVMSRAWGQAALTPAPGLSQRIGARMDEDGMTGLMRETLQEGLSRWQGRPVNVRELRRQFFFKSWTLRAEQVRVRVDGGGWLEVFFKDLNPRHQIEAARRLHKTELEPGYRELQVYRQILSPERFGTPQLYASRWDPPGEVFWLFLEN